MSSTQKRVAVVGGSLAGLSAAVLLEREGMDVSVFEKRADYQQVTGGGIVVQKVMLDLLDEVGECSDARLALSGRQFLDEHGAPKSAMEAPQHSGSWSSIWRALRAAFKGHYHAGVSVTGLKDASSSVALAGDFGEQEFDFVIVADGGGSNLRKQLLGDELEPPAYAGYVAWRGVVPPEDLTPELREVLMNGKVSFFHGEKTHILLYPIPVPGGVALNWVWYWNLPEDELHSVVKDSRLGREGIFSVPPGMLGERVEVELRRLAREELPANLRRVVDVTRQPFLQPIVDYRAPRMLFHGGRAALLGDAACILRPHTTYGTAKAVEEARGLVEALRAGGAALREWEASALARNESLTRYGAFLGKSQQDRDAREKLQALQGGRLDSSKGAETVIAAHGGA
jgi:2-polyprenyl-6-methoxyphenol hydroxylase-like FAD-dependent oxidoreductase